jgi:hypothetical protein
MLGFHAYGLLQKWLPNRTMAFNARLGGGIFPVLKFQKTGSGGDFDPVNTLIPSMNLGVSFMWLFYRSLYGEFGVEYTHLFSTDDTQPGYIIPSLGLGWRF